MIFLLYSIILNSGTDGIFNKSYNNIEEYCRIFNEFCLILFKYLKYLFILSLFLIGFLTLLRLRGIYRDQRIRNIKKNEDEDSLKRPRIIIGWLYIFLAFGFLTNSLIYFLILILDPLPDRFIFNFLEFSKDIDPYYLNSIENIEAARYPHEKTIYYCFALISFLAFIELIITFCYLINNGRLVNNPMRAITHMIITIALGMMFGFTTFLPLFL
ncbi:MAG: hypothetical protein ACTSQJ_19945 [Promethearchaeota archaeon]